MNIIVRERPFRCCPWLLALLSGGAGAAEPAALGGSPIGAGYLAELVVGLLVVVVGIVALAWLLKRMNRFQGSAGGALKVVDGLALGTRERVVLVQVGDEQLLLGVAPGRVETLHVLAHTVTPAPAEQGAFAERLTRAMNRRSQA